MLRMLVTTVDITGRCAGTIAHICFNSALIDAGVSDGIVGRRPSTIAVSSFDMNGNSNSENGSLPASSSHITIANEYTSDCTNADDVSASHVKTCHGPHNHTHM